MTTEKFWRKQRQTEEQAFPFCCFIPMKTLLYSHSHTAHTDLSQKQIGCDVQNKVSEKSGFWFLYLPPSYRKICSMQQRLDLLKGHKFQSNLLPNYHCIYSWTVSGRWSFCKHFCSIYVNVQLIFTDRNQKNSECVSKWARCLSA